MEALKGVRWLVLKTPPLSRNLVLLKSILSSRFPQIDFEYKRFQKPLFSKIKKVTGVDGIIAVLKNFETAQLPLFDQLVKKFSRSEIIFVLSPKTYQILNKKRKKTLNASLFLLSEVKCLDYITALPRLIDQVSVRHKLKRENEALQKLFRQNWEGPLPAEWTESSWHPQTLERHQPPQISIRLANWSQISKELGSIAEIEFDQMIQRLLSSNIRGGDRVMRRHQNEYLLLFSDLDKNQLKKCKQRLQQSLKELRLEANEKSIPIKVQVSQPDPARSAS